MIGLGKPFFHVAEFQGHKFVDVPLIGVFVDLRIGFSQAFLNDITVGSGSYSTRMSSKAASAVSSSKAATAATGSPTILTFSTQSASSSWLTGRIP